MRHMMMIAMLGALALGTGLGCSHNKSDTDSDQSAKKMSMQDDCPMCPGIQHANADGTCPKCGMKVKG